MAAATNARPAPTPGLSRNMSSTLSSAITSAGMMDEASADTFSRLVERYVEQRANPLDWERVERPDGLISPLATLATCPPVLQVRQEVLRKLAVVKLNGGLGTSMGLRGPKSALRVRSVRQQGGTFLDMTVKQVEFLNTKYGVDIPLLLMNSFNTHEETLKIVRKYSHHNVSITCFMQSCYPVVEVDHYTLLPTGRFSQDTAEEWYPPGHGDVYRALYRSGVLDQLLSAGKEWVFISNVDNLGATVDLDILYHMATTDLEMTMEVTQRTRSDVQGGTLIKYGESLKLLELSQVPVAHQDDFKSVSKFTAFNTNNLWVSLKAIRRLVLASALEPTVIVTSRTVREKEVLQLETAAGSAIEFFAKAIAVQVPRLRFVPVKNTSDLLVIQSNLLTIKHGSVLANDARELVDTPVVKLGPEFSDIKEYYRRLPHCPDLLHLEHLTVTGNVFFGKNVSLRGTVIIVASDGARIDVPDGSVLEDKVVTGDLRIVDH